MSHFVIPRTSFTKEPSVCCEVEFCSGKPPETLRLGGISKIIQTVEQARGSPCSQSKAPGSHSTSAANPYSQAAFRVAQNMVPIPPSPSSCPHSGSITQTRNKKKRHSPSRRHRENKVFLSPGDGIKKRLNRHTQVRFESKACLITFLDFIILSCGTVIKH